MPPPEFYVLLIWFIGAVILNFVIALLSRNTKDINPPLICLIWVWPCVLFFGVVALILLGPAALGIYLRGKRQ